MIVAQVSGVVKLNGIPLVEKQIRLRGEGKKSKYVAEKGSLLKRKKNHV